MLKIIQELAKLRSQPGKSFELEKVDAEEEELKEKESKDDGGETEEAPKMIDGKPVVFASLDIREKKKAQAQIEVKQDTANNVKKAEEI